MKLNIYKTQTEIEKTYEVDAYDLMYGIVEDVLNVIEEAGHGKDNLRLAQVIAENRQLSRLMDSQERQFRHS